MENFYTFEKGYLRLIDDEKITDVHFEHIILCVPYGDHTAFLSADKTCGFVKLKLGKAFEKFDMPCFVFFRRDGFVNLCQVERILPLKAGSSIHQMLLKNEEYCDISRIWFKRFKPLYDAFNIRKYNEQLNR